MNGHVECPIRTIAVRDPAAVAETIDEHGVVAIDADLEPDDLLRADRPLQRGGSVERDDPSVIDDRHPIAELVSLLHVVRRQQHGTSDPLQLAYPIAEVARRLRI